MEVVARRRAARHRGAPCGHLRQDPRPGQAALPRGRRLHDAGGRHPASAAARNQDRRESRREDRREDRPRRRRPCGLDPRPRLSLLRRVGADPGGRPDPLHRAGRHACVARRPPRPPERPDHGMEGDGLRRLGRTRRVGSLGRPRRGGGRLRQRRDPRPAFAPRGAPRRVRAAPEGAGRTAGRADAPRADGHPGPSRRTRLRGRAPRRGGAAERSGHRSPHVRHGTRGGPPRRPEEDPLARADADRGVDRALPGRRARGAGRKARSPWSSTFRLLPRRPGRRASRSSTRPSSRRSRRAESGRARWRPKSSFALSPSRPGSPGSRFLRLLATPGSPSPSRRSFRRLHSLRRRTSRPRRPPIYSLLRPRRFRSSLLHRRRLRSWTFTSNPSRSPRTRPRRRRRRFRHSHPRRSRPARRVPSRPLFRRRRPATSGRLSTPCAVPPGPPFPLRSLPPPSFHTLPRRPP